MCGSILVVEDDPLLRELLAAALGPCALTAASVSDASRLLRCHPFACVISDLNLGDGDGITVLLAARELQPEARRWLITGDPDERSSSAVHTGLAERVLRKPWTLEALRAITL